MLKQVGSMPARLPVDLATICGAYVYTLCNLSASEFAVGVSRCVAFYAVSRITQTDRRRPVKQYYDVSCGLVYWIGQQDAWRVDFEIEIHTSWNIHDLERRLSAQFTPPDPTRQNSQRMSSGGVN